MATRIYISNLEAGFFTNNSLICASSIPNEGRHVVGDLVISSVQRDEVIGWVCVEAGEPGKWQSIRSAGDWLQVELENINENISKINIYNKELDASIKLLHEEISVNKAEISKSKTDINIIKNDIINVKTDVASNASNIEKAQDDIKSNTQYISTINQDIVSINKKINDLNGVVDDNNNSNVGGLSELEAKIQANAKAIEEINANIDASKEEIDDVVEGIMTSITNNNKEIEANKTNISELQNTIEGINSELENVTEDITKNQESVDSNIEELENMKQGLIDALVNKGIDVGEEPSWSDLFNSLINNLQPVPEEIPCTYLAFKQESLELEVGDSYNMKSLLEIEPEDCTEQITWTIIDNMAAITDVSLTNEAVIEPSENIGSISNEGVITASDIGMVIVEVTCGELKATINVIIN